MTVSCGATEAMIAAMLAAVDPGDEVDRLRAVLRELRTGLHPQRRDSALCHRCDAPDWSFDPDELRQRLQRRRRGRSSSTPRTTRPARSTREPSSSCIAGLCLETRRHRHHRRDLRAPRLRGEPREPRDAARDAERTITISGASKTYSVTGWRIGWLIARRRSLARIRKVHDFLTVGAAHPLQVAVAAALGLPPSFYIELLGDYRNVVTQSSPGLTTVGSRWRRLTARTT